MSVFPIAYFPSINYLNLWIKQEAITLEIHENFPKQTIRNRCEILSGNGILRLSIPVEHASGQKIQTKDIKIVQTGSWKTDHWRAIESAYASAPFFEDYAEEIKKIIFESTGFLIDTTNHCLDFVAEILDQKMDYAVTSEYKHTTSNDFRNFDFFQKEDWKLPEYQQVFSYNKPFTPNLSIIDLIFNEGPFIRKWILENNPVNSTTSNHTIA
ncbi:MAG: hypothetical protein EBQ94_12285 [Flavobacteriales bacterium]|nr:hypothetical protein [Crocinitomicaceae bacterium]NBX81132.1 hypothetical protein [Flavobacteriales bacterium]NCA21632.1 hypothetical protein [Crocinitomicaceae bacterium]